MSRKQGEPRYFTNEQFVDAFNNLIAERDSIFAAYKDITADLTDNTALEKETLAIQDECDVVLELMRQAVNVNAQSALDQADYQLRYDSLYFADTYSSWQRGSNENSNGLLREFYPKKKNLALVCQEELTHNLFLINSRPRKCLGWKSSIQVFLHELAHLT